MTKFKQRNKALALIKQGYNYLQAAKEVGVTNKTVSVWHKKELEKVSEKSTSLVEIKNTLQEVVKELKELKNKL